MKIKITKKHIKEGKNLSYKCPIALALLEFPGIDYVSVGMDDVLIEKDKKFYYFELPEIAAKFIESCNPDQFVVNSKTRPIGFTLETDVITGTRWKDLF